MRLNSDHHEIILNFAEKNPQIITNRWVGLGSNQDVKQLWDLLTTQLNSLGYGTLTTNEYKRRLTDWKSKTKSKASDINNSVSKTGGGPESDIKLTNHESRLLALMGNKSFEGDIVVELGMKNVPILSKKSQPLIKQNQNLPTQVKRKFVRSPLQSPVFSTPVYQPLDQIGSPSKKKHINSFQVEFENIEVLDEIEVSEIVDETDCIENEQGNYINQEPCQEHNYTVITPQETKSIKPSAKPSTSTRRRNKILNLSKDIQNVNDQTLSILKDIKDNLSNINSNLTKIGDNISRLTDAVCLIIEKNNL